MSDGGASDPTAAIAAEAAAALALEADRAVLELSAIAPELVAWREPSAQAITFDLVVESLRQLEEAEARWREQAERECVWLRTYLYARWDERARLSSSVTRVDGV